MPSAVPQAPPPMTASRITAPNSSTPPLVSFLSPVGSPSDRAASAAAAAHQAHRQGRDEASPARPRRSLPHYPYKTLAAAPQSAIPPSLQGWPGGGAARRWLLHHRPLPAMFLRGGDAGTTRRRSSSGRSVHRRSQAPPRRRGLPSRVRRARPPGQRSDAPLSSTRRTRNHSPVCPSSDVVGQNS